MAFGMAGHADGRDAARLDQSAGADIEARPERTFGQRDVAGDQKNARDIRLAPRPRQKIAERFPARHLTGGDMRHRVVASTAQRGRRIDVVAIMIAGEKGDRDIRARGKIVPQLLQLMSARGDLDGSGPEPRGESA
jgi:hypothetical protein